MTEGESGYEVSGGGSTADPASEAAVAASADDAMLSDMGHHHMGHFHGELSPKAFPAAAGFWSTYSAPGWMIMVLMSTFFIFIVH